MIYVWAAIAIAILFLIWQIIRWWNLPATIEARNKAAAARAERWANRPRLFPKRSTPNPQPELPPTADTAEAIKRATEPKPLLDGPVARRIRARRSKK